MLLKEGRCSTHEYYIKISNCTRGEKKKDLTITSLKLIMMRNDACIFPTQSVVSKPVASAFTRSYSETQNNLRPHSTPVESESAF